MSSSAQEAPDDAEMAEHKKYMLLALAEARRSPPRPTNFCVGACLVARHHDGDSDASSLPVARLLVTGFTLECPGNTHAEQSCFIKLAAANACSVAELGRQLPAAHIDLYTTMEPCNARSVGNTPCVDRVLALIRADGSCAIRRVLVGVWEPETFVGVNSGRRRLEEAGVQVTFVPGFEEEILKVATAGHGRTE